MTLPNDIARCAGREYPARMFWGSRQGLSVERELAKPCVDCKRRTDPGEGEHMEPPDFVDGQCQERIA